MLIIQNINTKFKILRTIKIPAANNKKEKTNIDTLQYKIFSSILLGSGIIKKKKLAIKPKKTAPKHIFFITQSLKLN